MKPRRRTVCARCGREPAEGESFVASFSGIYLCPECEALRLRWVKGYRAEHAPEEVQA